MEKGMRHLVCVRNPRIYESPRNEVISTTDENENWKLNDIQSRAFPVNGNVHSNHFQFQSNTHASVDLNTRASYAVSCVHCWRTHTVVFVSVYHLICMYWRLACVRPPVCVCVRPRLRHRVYFSMGRPNTIISRHTRDSVRDYRIAITHKETARPTTHANERAERVFCVHSKRKRITLER